MNFIRTLDEIGVLCYNELNGEKMSRLEEIRICFYLDGTPFAERHTVQVPNVGDGIKFNVEGKWKGYVVTDKEWEYGKDEFRVTIFLENI